VSAGLLRRLAERSLGLSRPVRSIGAAHETVSLPESLEIQEFTDASAPGSINPRRFQAVGRGSAPDRSGELTRRRDALVKTSPAVAHEGGRDTSIAPLPQSQPADAPYGNPPLRTRHVEPATARTIALSTPAPLLPTQPPRWNVIATARADDEPRRQSPSAADVSNEVHVSIGRVELIAAPGPPVVRRAPATKARRSLEEYLRPREKGRT